jgi:hypothetical protein
VSRSSIRGLPIVVVLAIVMVAAWQRWGDDRGPRATDPSATAPAPAAPPPAGTAPGPEASDPSRRDLSIDESRGGHTLARHVGKSDDALRQRLARERGISAASTYTDRATAETVVARALVQHDSRVRAWTSRVGNRPNLALSYQGAPGQIIGRTLLRGGRDAVPSTGATVVLRWDGRGFYVLTSYPEVRR